MPSGPALKLRHYQKFALVDDLAGRDAEVLDDPVLYFGRTPADIVLKARGC